MKIKGGDLCESCTLVSLYWCGVEPSLLFDVYVSVKKVELFISFVLLLSLGICIILILSDVRVSVTFEMNSIISLLVKWDEHD